MTLLDQLSMVLHIKGINLKQAKNLKNSKVQFFEIFLTLQDLTPKTLKLSSYTMTYIFCDI